MANIPPYLLIVNDISNWNTINSEMFWLLQVNLKIFMYKMNILDTSVILIMASDHWKSCLFLISFMMKNLMCIAAIKDVIRKTFLIDILYYSSFRITAYFLLQPDFHLARAYQEICTGAATDHEWSLLRGAHCTS